MLVGLRHSTKRSVKPRGQSIPPRKVKMVSALSLAVPWPAGAHDTTERELGVFSDKVIDSTRSVCGAKFIETLVKDPVVLVSKGQSRPFLIYHFLIRVDSRRR